MTSESSEKITSVSWSSGESNLNLSETAGVFYSYRSVATGSSSYGGTSFLQRFPQPFIVAKLPRPSVCVSRLWTSNVCSSEKLSPKQQTQNWALGFAAVLQTITFLFLHLRVDITSSLWIGRWERMDIDELSDVFNWTHWNHSVLRLYLSTGPWHTELQRFYNENRSCHAPCGHRTQRY